MKLIRFRPYKKYTDEKLISHIQEAFRKIRCYENLEENMVICDEMIYEAKIRNLKCGKETLYKNILEGDGL
ncbi:MAG: hypothetical protein N4A57_07870 [Anaeromicrobium sp.]|jgi:hypothetical protein|uniref:hypothetical protein n=1 Tax=Anaeromicrobium sp. TaxID=1929132 RepID=UPI0025DEAC33|nr:hypothetical protein [Anaeromicrobium sp.]MCT4594167.1 hypothetical protein [Anaeromicrobium sp.]